jgi:UDP-glucuronate decarboxylase
MHYLVAGGAGFLGSTLCRRLISRGDTVTCVDNLQTGSLSNLLSLQGAERFHFCRADVTKPFDVTHQIDAVINLACPASPAAYLKDPIGTTRTAVVGTLNLLELAQANGAVFLQASTSEVYGSPSQHPQREEYWGHVNPNGPRACYDEGKRCAESLCFDYRRQYGMDVRVVRIFNTYGPGMSIHDGRVVTNLIRQALTGEPLTLYGEGLQTRSFCYVDDLIEGIEYYLDSPPLSESVLNMGNPNEITMRALADHILNLTGSASSVIHKSLPEDDPPRRRPDITRAKALLGWYPHTDLYTGLRLTIDWVSSQL